MNCACDLLCIGITDGAVHVLAPLVAIWGVLFALRPYLKPQPGTVASVEIRRPSADGLRRGQLRLIAHQERLASVAVAKHREVLLSVGFSTRSTKKLHVQPLREHGLHGSSVRGHRQPFRWQSHWPAAICLPIS